ncbi:MAG: hypothetical protein EOR78_29420 [Mesorhizobium sp.]|nr:MAG: hypothetical protein EOR78_29420 [Mesorhizobium sp.]
MRPSRGPGRRAAGTRQMSQFVATTTLSLMRSLGSTAERSVHRMQALLGREFPNGIGLELAEPVPRKDGSGIDWYTEREDPLVRLTDLPAETADFYKARLQHSVQAVLRAAAAHDSRGDTTARSTATALRNAVTFPGDENVWISGGSGRGDGMLVLTAWGYERHDAETSGRGEISGKSDRIPTIDDIKPPPAPPSGRFWKWLAASVLWLIPIVLAGAIAWLLLPACGVALPFGLTAFGKGGGAYCALVAPPPTVDQARLHTQELMAEAAVLEEQLRRHLNSCVRTPLQSDVSKDMDKKLGDRKGQTGKLQVTLTWHTRDDLDLIAECPGGTLGWNDKGPGICGDGIKDVDSNRFRRENLSSEPVENIFWQKDIPSGSYVFEVNPTSIDLEGNPTKEIPFEIRFRYQDKEKVCLGSVSSATGGDGKQKSIKWNLGDPLPECDFMTADVHACKKKSECKQ